MTSRLLRCCQTDLAESRRKMLKVKRRTYNKNHKFRCRCRRWFHSFICVTCQEEIISHCTRCHSNKVHHGWHFKEGIVCRHCKQITPIPTYNATKVFYLVNVKGLTIADAALGTTVWRTDKVTGRAEKRPISTRQAQRLLSEFTYLCQKCQERLIPRPHELKVLFLLRSSGANQDEFTFRLTQQQVAEKLGKTLYYVKDVVKNCKERYGLSYMALGSARHFRIFYIGGTVELDRDSYSATHKNKAEHPIGGHGWQYEKDWQ